MLSIGEFARKTGLSVRALHFYEEKGLIAPARSKNNDRRYYGQSEFEDVQKIVSLKQLGFPLSEIKRLLKGGKTPLPQILGAQLKALEAEKEKAEAAINLLKTAIAALNDGEGLDIRTLTKLIRMTTMTETAKKEMKKVYTRYFTDEQLKELEARKPSDEEQRAYQTEWREIMNKAKALLGTDPAALEAQALAKRGQELVSMFTHGDQEIKKSLGHMYSEVDTWSEQLEALMGMDVETFKKIQAFLNEAAHADQ